MVVLPAALDMDPAAGIEGDGAQCIWGIRSKMVKTPFCTFKNCFKNKNSFFRVIPTVVYMSEYVLTFYLADTLIFYLVPEDALSCILSDIWSGIFVDVLLDIFSGILSGI